MNEIVGKDEYEKLTASPDMSAAIRAMLEPLIVIMIESKVGAVSIKTKTTDERRWELFAQLVEVGAVATVAAPIKSKGEDRHAREVQAVPPDSQYPSYIGFVILAIMAGILVWLVFWGIWISS